MYELWTRAVAVCFLNYALRDMPDHRICQTIGYATEIRISIHKVLTVHYGDNGKVLCRRNVGTLRMVRRVNCQMMPPVVSFISLLIGLPLLVFPSPPFPFHSNSKSELKTSRQCHIIYNVLLSHTQNLMRLLHNLFCNWSLKLQPNALLCISTQKV